MGMGWQTPRPPAPAGAGDCGQLKRTVSVQIACRAVPPGQGVLGPGIAQDHRAANRTMRSAA
jgi:hypothetical protein